VAERNSLTVIKEAKMEREYLKKILAGLGVATLIAGAGLAGACKAGAS
jgi:radical SAM modification target selenobiotic family peptide